MFSVTNVCMHVCVCVCIGWVWPELQLLTTLYNGTGLLQQRCQPMINGALFGHLQADNGTRAHQIISSTAKVQLLQGIK